MRQAWKKKRVDVFRMSWTRDYASRKNIANLVALIRRKIQDDPDINPAVGLLVAIQLCAVHREHEDHIVVVNIAVLNSVKIVRATEDIVVGVVVCIPIASAFLLSLGSPIIHFLSRVRASPTSLKLRTDRK